ncbi:hypothetical protein [Elizabethkingia anophelis]|nr:hypothetical protein [Elizabethkingia anophelis]MCW2462791.1 hypothetical protein [Elizabethkingia anophelis]MCW2466476.1 hypothetical protein [Elizabethkingia anophelis]MCW2470160.1 hypothetical protein [Elizabethkingia anophelis]
MQMEKDKGTLSGMGRLSEYLGEKNAETVIKCANSMKVENIL